eukprot:PhM_4_TR5216/c0_g1_i2/m.103711/K08838/STK24_25_MST4; serine/threonine-protein kinase 24/25/MST4
MSRRPSESQVKGNDRYDLLDRLSTDNSCEMVGYLQRASDRVTGNTVVIRIIPSASAELRSHIKSQWECVGSMSGLVPLIETRVVQDAFWMVHPFFSHGSLYDMMQQQKGKRLSETLITSFLPRILDALYPLHARGLVHGHIKASNIIFGDSNELLLADFGLAGGVHANVIEESKSPYLYWLPPEACSPSAKTTHLWDSWELGTLTFELASGTPPYVQFAPHRALTLVRDHTPPILVGNFSPRLKAFVACCLTREVAKRPKLEQLRNDPYLAGMSGQPPGGQGPLHASSNVSALTAPEEYVRSASFSGRQNLSVLNDALRTVVKHRPTVTSEALSTLQDTEDVLPSLSDELIEELKAQLRRRGVRWLPEDSSKCINITTADLNKYMSLSWKLSSQQALNDL